MKQIQLKTELRLKWPPYYACHYPLIDLHLRQMHGESLISLPPNAEMCGVGVFATQIDAPTTSPFIISADKVFKATDYLLQLKTVGVPSFAEGLCLLEERIRRNEPVIVTGATYELPHNPDYHNPHFFNLKPLGVPDGSSDSGGRFSVSNHSLAVIGLSATEVLVYDAIPQPMCVTLSMETFANFWKGLGQFDVFAGSPGYAALETYGITDVTLGPNYQTGALAQTSLRLLNQINRAYLEGRTRTSYGRLYLSGAAVNEHVCAYFQQQYEATGEVPRSLAKCIFDMRWSRCFLRDFLLDLNQELQLPLQSALAEIRIIQTAWEDIYTAIHTMTRRSAKISPEQAQRFLGLLQAVSTREIAWHTQLLELVPNLGHGSMSAAPA